jgi:hypothetical protein
MQNMPTATADTGGIPPVKNTADQRERFCTKIDTHVTVSGVEYFRPRREATNAEA